MNGKKMKGRVWVQFSPEWANTKRERAQFYS